MQVAAGLQGWTHRATTPLLWFLVALVAPCVARKCACCWASLTLQVWQWIQGHRHDQSLSVFSVEIWNTFSRMIEKWELSNIFGQMLCHTSLRSFLQSSWVGSKHFVYIWMVRVFISLPAIRIGRKGAPRIPTGTSGYKSGCFGEGKAHQVQRYQVALNYPDLEKLLDFLCVLNSTRASCKDWQTKRD